MSSAPLLLRVSRPPEPSDVLWENLPCSRLQCGLRQLLVTLIMFGVSMAGTVLIVGFSYASPHFLPGYGLDEAIGTTFIIIGYLLVFILVSRLESTYYGYTYYGYTYYGYTYYGYTHQVLRLESTPLYLLRLYLLRLYLLWLHSLGAALREHHHAAQVLQPEGGLHRAQACVLPGKRARPRPRPRLIRVRGRAGFRVRARLRLQG